MNRIQFAILCTALGVLQYQILSLRERVEQVVAPIATTASSTPEGARSFTVSVSWPPSADGVCHTPDSSAVYYSVQ